MNSTALPETFADPVSKPSTVATNIILRFFPSLTDLAFLLPIIALFALFGGARTLLGDGDTGWHIRTGDWMLQHRQVPYKDLFSFTKPDGDWFAWEWGCDVLFSAIHSRWSLSGIVFFNALVLGFVSILLYRLVRRHAPNDIIALILATLAMGGSSLHWLARPHLLSWVFILVFLHLIDRAEGGNKHLLWWSPLLTVLWVNLHGSFFVGILFLLTYGVVNTVQGIAFSNDTESCRKAILYGRTYLLCSLACLGASLLNPYGWHLHQHVVQYLLDAKQLSGIKEYASLDFHSPLALFFELFLVLGICSAFRCFTGKQWAQAVTLILWVHLALKSARNIPIFFFVAAPPSALLLKNSLEAIEGSAVAHWLRRTAADVLSFGQDFRSFERVERLPLAPVAAAVFLAAALGVLPGTQPRFTDFDTRDFPVDAASVIAQQPNARVFTFDQWGDYLIYRFFPRKLAFVDGRSDFYGTEFGDQWLNTLEAKHNWNAELSRFSINTVLVKTYHPLASVLKQSSEWMPIFDNGTAIVFRKKNTIDSGSLKTQLASSKSKVY